MATKKSLSNYLKLIISISIPLSVGFIGSLFTIPFIKTWYVALNKPSFNPPNWIFGPVWTTLFILMGIALYLVWSSEKKPALIKSGLWIFGIQLIFNVLWSLVFFTLHSPFWALINILVLWGLILATILQFSKINKTASFLLLPYILWVSFASFLNFTIFLLNP
jgi:translocator protein